MNVFHNIHFRQLFLSLALLFASSVGAVSITAAQITAFQSLSPDKQRLLLEQMAGKKGGVATQPDASQPELIKPRFNSRRADYPIQGDAEQSQEDARQIQDYIEQNFQGYTEQSQEETEQAQDELKLFGYDLFAGQPTTFAPVTEIPVPAEYVVGPGDNVRIQLFGKDNVEHDLVVSRSGLLNFPGIGPISVAGLSFTELKRKINAQVKKQMIGVKASISMGELRSMRIFILGNAYQPGSYTVSSLSTITNALFVSGGVKEIGSLRNIQLKRKGKVISTFDLYQLLLNGDTSNDARLLPGDVIFIPPIGPTVGISGAVQRPAIYELLNKEKSVKNIIQFSGGLLPTAYKKAGKIERISKNGRREIVKLNLSRKEQYSHKIHDGDVIRIASIIEEIDGAIKVSGHVQRPGEVQWIEGMRISDLLGSIENDLLGNADLNYALIRRELKPSRRVQVLTVNLKQAIENRGSTFDTLLDSRDELLVFGIAEDRQERLAPLLLDLQQQASYGELAREVHVAGNIHFPGSYPLIDGMRVSDLIQAGYTLLPNTDQNYAILERRSLHGERVTIETLDLKAIIAEPNGIQDLQLKPQDQLHLFSLYQEQIEPQEKVSLYQEQAEQLGQIPYDPQKAKQSNQIPREHEQTKNLNQISRNQTIKPEQPRLALKRTEQLKELLERLERQTMLGEPSQVVTMSGNVRYPGKYPLAKNMTVHDLIQAAGFLSQDAYQFKGELIHQDISGGQKKRIIRKNIDFTQAILGNIDHDIRLQPLDVVNVMKIPQWKEHREVTLAGEFKFPGTYVLEEGETILEIIERVGGVTESGFIDGAIFLRSELQKREKEQLDLLSKRLKSELASLAIGAIGESTLSKDKGTVNMAADMEYLLTMVEDNKPAGRLVIDLQEILLSGLNSRKDIELRNGDKLFIPKIPYEITVIGEVQFPSSHVERYGHSAYDYIHNAGGENNLADLSKTYVVKSNGQVITDVVGTFFSMGYNPKPGDTIIVPQDLARIRPLTYWTSISDILYKFGIAAAAWKTVGVF